VEQRKLAVDLAEVIVKWECQRMKEDSDDTVPQVNGINNQSVYRSEHGRILGQPTSQASHETIHCFSRSVDACWKVRNVPNLILYAAFS